MKIHNRGKFHHYSICSCYVENFQSFAYCFSIHEIALFGRFLGPYSNMVQYCRNSHRGSTLAHKNTAWKFFEGFVYLWKSDGPKVSTFGPTLTSLYLLKMAKIENNKQSCGKFQPLSYPNMSKWSLYLLSPFREKYGYFLQYLG